MLPFIVEHNSALCTGCGACVQCCPEACISMRTDAEGFAYPQIDTQRCIKCGLCSSVCPSSGDGLGLHRGAPQPQLFAAWHLDDQIRHSSSSGGVFTALAQTILSAGGVVYGAAFDELWRLRHVGIGDEAQLAQLRGSKYLQSATCSTFCEVEAHLAIGSSVLYSGTPCQISGLYAYLGGAQEGLVTVDLICHGVPSPLVFDAYLQHCARLAGDAPVSVSFRDKLKGWRRYSMHIEMQSGRHYAQTLDRDPFLIGFLRNHCLRPSCHSCSYAQVQRIADITLGDYWGIARFHPELDDDRGVSEVLVNTARGQRLFEACASRLFVQECPLEEGMQGGLCTPSVASPQRAAFFCGLERLTFAELRTKYLRPCAKPTWRRMASRLVRRLLPRLRRLRWS
ncbi:MAG: 4Fe-4S dicluster domain-containing protein [Anaerolineales bacterium]|nr:4Fe-4S dicluster domain-containing protein [Anaerolineales bacterium]